MKFKTAYSFDPSEYVTCPGDPNQQTYKYEIIDGVKQLVPDSFTDTQAFIQSFAESADIHTIIARFMAGETEVLDVKKGFYADVRTFPTTYAEIYSHIQEAQRTFDALPVDVKAEFDNSYMKYFDEYGSPGWLDKISKFTNSPVDLTDKEELKNE